MPSRKGLEQALTWLRSKMAEKDTLDAVNAEVTYNVLMDIQNKRKIIGALYHQAHAKNRENARRLEASAGKMFYPEEWDGESG